MHEIVGTNSVLASASTASYNYESTEKEIKTEVNMETSSDFDSLLNELVQMCNHPTPNVKVEESLCKNPYFDALQLVFDNYKERISLPSPLNEVNKLQDQSKALDRSLSDCISNIADTDKDDSDLTIATVEQSIIDTYESLPKSIDVLNDEIWKRRSAMQVLLSRHQTIRPISDNDMDNMDNCFKIQQLYWSNQIKTQICNFSMMATSYFLRRQRRRNFPKKATRILNHHYLNSIKKTHRSLSS